MQTTTTYLDRVRPAIRQVGERLAVLVTTPPDPDLPEIDPVPNAARPADVRVVQNDGFGFGGNNAIVMLSAVS